MHKIFSFLNKMRLFISNKPLFEKIYMSVVNDQSQIVFMQLRSSYLSTFHSNFNVILKVSLLLSFQKRSNYQRVITSLEHCVLYFLIMEKLLVILIIINN